MFRIVSAFISFPWIGYLLGETTGAFIGLILAVLYIPIEKFQGKPKEKKEVSAEKVKLTGFPKFARILLIVSFTFTTLVMLLIYL
ncbi:hypothetical protein Amet_4353 [Alkaliphilus metalliredigens QYMF]|uniref:Uncharacterized protein n=1 Tax=Alkaliphilus metalliredigens (strain QYMF) TaxID=293826 RepID=A6TKD8_ALKMQ|nr:hypothetical protein [Alkaliphilus metalliredigens]ABR46656.1 hypothetical protein Amet_0428 [Alkaliphilus metalliredigens QYMF]ABR48128.1 hypothetical protein Amet_1965 [Alkaliphilus metalliredigens QYMF]ABR50427.1 hypothetical protein Amet_4353 [Alkaliphilus metalliredigens QYMF]